MRCDVAKVRPYYIAAQLFFCARARHGKQVASHTLGFEAYMLYTQTERPYKHTKQLNAEGGGHGGEGQADVQTRWLLDE